MVNVNLIVCTVNVSQYLNIGLKFSDIKFRNIQLELTLFRTMYGIAFTCFPYYYISFVSNSKIQKSGIRDKIEVVVISSESVPSPDTVLLSDVLVGAMMMKKNVYK